MSINNLTIGTILAKTIPYLAEKGIPNPRLEADLMLAGVLQLARVKLYAQWDRPLESGEVQAYREIISKRVQGWPLAYLTGCKTFLSWDFVVSPAVLIPRSETEILVEAVYDLFKGQSGLRGIDVGTGSGAIGISLARLLPDSQWIATDISAEALEVTKINVDRLEVTSRFQLIQGDLLEPVLEQKNSFDLIVSNPPYIPSDDIKGLQPEVRREPLSALDGGVDGLELYRRLLPQAYQILKKDGVLAVEHGYDQREALVNIFKENGFTCRTISDLAGLDRIVIGNRQ